MTTPNRPPLSPAAQAVLDAYGHEVGGIAALTSYERRGIAAALRAAADHTEAESIWKGHPEHTGVRWTTEALRIIAAELEGHG